MKHKLSAALICSCFCFACLGQQPAVRVGEVTSSASEISCGSQENSATVSVQIFFDSTDARLRNHRATVGLAMYSTDPVRNRLSITQTTKTITLTSEPTPVDFEVRCSAETTAGQIVLAAAITGAPPGVNVTTTTMDPKSLLTIKTKR